MPATLEAIPTPIVSPTYEPGAILEYSWGYDQTNIDYYLMVSRKGDWLTLIALKTAKKQQTGFLQGTSEAGTEPEDGAMPFRRKVYRDREGREFGCRIQSYGWCSLWDGKPSHWTAYS